ncbi:hypothetical protein ACFP63_08835 [Oerskovia jenensis]|uniref:Uncharacterized protein n=1 Tax=Oerskovia jenensis TaxID=162169 RepID=A0ABS2LIA8_9CELL|nr:hypothetical protein [Oerskovia jenensis]MBM7480159.1 hypothetical protein [Oerskovia jenensis]
MTVHTVRPGQIWADNDKRSAGRRVTVLSVGQTHALVETSLLRRTSIRLDRFRPTSTGYRLVKDVTE